MSAPFPAGALCPWDERRLPREMYVKLFVVHFTVIGSYAHLMHLRREPRYFGSYLLMIACPIAGVALLVSPVIILSIQLLVCRGDRNLLKQSAGILIGRVMDPERNAIHAATVHGPPEFSSKLIRGIVVQLALLAQCIISIWLFARRAHHGSVALYDYRILQLSILGLSTSTMSIVHIFLRPQYPSKQVLNDYPVEVGWLAALRPLLSAELGGFWDTPWITEIPLVCIDWIYASIVLLIAQALGLEFEGLWSALLGVSRGYCFDDLRWNLENKAGLLILILLVMALSSIDERSPKLWKTLRRILWRLPLGLMIYVGLIISTCFLLLLTDVCLGPALNGLQLRTLLSKPKDYQRYATAIYSPESSSSSLNQTSISPDWSRIWTYGHVSASFPCPQAWQDPAADYVWWLA